MRSPPSWQADARLADPRDSRGPPCSARYPVTDRPRAEADAPRGARGPLRREAGRRAEGTSRDARAGRRRAYRAWAANEADSTVKEALLAAAEREDENARTLEKPSD